MFCVVLGMGVFPYLGKAFFYKLVEYLVYVIDLGFFYLVYAYDLKICLLPHHVSHFLFFVCFFFISYDYLVQILYFSLGPDILSFAEFILLVRLSFELSR